MHYRSVGGEISVLKELEFCGELSAALELDEEDDASSDEHAVGHGSVAGA